MKILTAIQPTNKITIGNYIGSIKEILDFQKKGHEIIIFIADLHAITVDYDVEKLKENVYTTLATYIACGIDPEKCTIFLQSQVSEHSELKHLLSPFVSHGDLTRMHQFKDKSLSQKYVSLALLDYPVLMAADILLYKPDIIPVGLDQIQHIEIMSNIAQRFNNKHAYFKIPKMHLSSTPKIMSLQQPNKKMSKSDIDPLASIYLLDDVKMIEKKIKKAVTDTIPSFEYSSDRLGLKNLIDINSAFSEEDVKTISSKYGDNQFGYFKQNTIDVLNDKVQPIKKEIERLLMNKDELNKILHNGKLKAKKEASNNISEIYEIMGFLR